MLGVQVFRTGKVKDRHRPYRPNTQHLNAPLDAGEARCYNLASEVRVSLCRVCTDLLVHPGQ